MKIILAGAKVAAIAAVFLCLLEGSASAISDPIPGVDIIVKKNPGGKAIQTTTDKEGKFVLADLEPGKYLLSVKMPQTKAALNTTRSNIKHPNRSLENGVEVFNVSVTLGTGQPAPVEIEITKNGGQIAGVVTSGLAPTKGGATPDRDTPAKATEGTGAK